MDTLESIQNLREIMLGERSNDAQLKRVETEKPQMVQAAAAVPTRTWYRIDRNAKASLTTKTGGPIWNKVTRRVTLSLDSGDILEGLAVNKITPEKALYRMLPKGTSGTCTILYHGNDSVAKMNVPAIQPQRVAAKPTTDATDGASEPNYVLGDEDDAQTARRQRSPRLNKLVDAERPDVAGNAPHRIVALAAAETAEIPRLTIQQHKLSKRYGVANLEL